MFSIIKIILAVFIVSAINLNAGWKQIDSLSNPVYDSYKFTQIDSYNGKDILILVGVDIDIPYIYKSADSGYTWQLKSFFDKNAVPYELEFPNRNLAIFTCDSGYYFRSTNNGETWQKLRFENQRRTWEVGFWDEHKGIVFQSRKGEKQIIQKSTDGGLTWFEISGPKPLHETALSYLVVKGKGSAYCIEVDNKVDSVYYFHKSTDYGETWQEPYKGPAVPPFGNFYFYNENIGFCFGGQEINYTPKGKLIRRTSDGGKTWKDVFRSNINNDPITDIHFSDSLNGIASSFSNVYRTYNSGVSWERDTSYNNSGLKTTVEKVLLIDANTAVGLSSLPFKYIYRYTADNPVSVTIYETISKFDVYPNPAVSYLNLDLPEGFGSDAEYSVISLDGKKLLKGLVTDRIDIQELISGTYYLLISKDKKILYSKFVKE